MSETAMGIVLLLVIFIPLVGLIIKEDLRRYLDVKADLKILATAEEIRNDVG